MVRRLEYDIRELLTEAGERFFELALGRTDHIFQDVCEFDAVMYAARQVGAHVFETRDMRRIPDGGHTFLLEEEGQEAMYYFMNWRDSYLVQLWIINRLRGARVGLVCLYFLYLRYLRARSPEQRHDVPEFMRGLVDSLPGWLAKSEEGERKKRRRKRKHAERRNEDSDDGGEARKGDEGGKRRRVDGHDRRNKGDE